MAIMLDNGKILDEELASRLSKCRELFVFTLDSSSGSAVPKPLTAWDGENVVLYEDKHSYELGAALDVVPVPDMDAPGYLMMTHREFNDAFADTYADFIVSAHVTDKKSCVVLNTDDTNEQMQEQHAGLAERYGLSVAYDSRLDKRFEEVRSWTSSVGKAWDYKGDIPVNVQRILLANIAIHDADRFYKSDVFRGGGREMRGITRHDRAASLMESLTLGLPCRPYPAYDREDPFTAWRESMIQIFLHDVDYTLSRELDDVVEGYRFYANLSVLWEEVAAKAPVCLDLDSTALRSKTKCANALSMLARAVDIHSYVDAYVSGVPLEDILA